MRVNKQIAALAISAVMGTAAFSAMPVMAAGTVQSAEASSSQEQSKMRKGPEDRISELVENGTISKETGEKISNYMKENRPEKKEKASGTEKPEKPFTCKSKATRAMARGWKPWAPVPPSGLQSRRSRNPSAKWGRPWWRCGTRTLIN